MRTLDLIVSHISAALSSLSHVYLCQFKRFAHLGWRQLLRQASSGNLRLEARQMLDEQTNYVWIKMIS